MKWRYRGEFHLQGKLKHAKDYSVVDIAPENSPKLLKWLEDNVPLIGGQAFCIPPPNESGGKVVGLIEVRLIL